MADRSHVKQSLPCESPNCRGFLKCDGGSKLVPFEGGIARRRYRECELCGRTIVTLEYRQRTLKAGTRGFFRDG